MFDRADHVVEMVRDFLRFFHRAERAIHDVISAVGHVGFLVRGEPHRWVCAELFQFSVRGLPSELHDLYGDGNQRAELLDDLRFIRDHHQRLLAAATIFSRSSAPPCPLIR